MSPIESINASLSESERLCAGATEGPWRAGRTDMTTYDAMSGDGPYKHVYSEGGDIPLKGYGPDCVPNAQMAAASRTRWPNETAALRCAVEALGSIEEYWNRDPNDIAMVDACEHAIEAAHDTLAKIAAILERGKA